MEKHSLLNLSNCKICPHECGTNRYKSKGYCNVGHLPLVASVFAHKGEEPVISGENGICNVFFAHCNLQCVFCQNYQISKNSTSNPGWMSNKHQIVDEIIKILDNDINIVGFVSPSHQVVQMIEIINEINKKGYNPTIVYNSNGYDKVETLKELENVVDVYLPDLKYYNNQIAFRYSGIKNYFEVASMAIKEMYRQKGASIVLNDKNLIEFGLIIRHLVLPTHADDSINLLKFLANNISNRLYISLMSQYYPPKDLLLPNELKENLSTNEYNKVVKIIEDLGFRGWIQEAESQSHYKPNFDNDIPFSE